MKSLIGIITAFVFVAIGVFYPAYSQAPMTSPLPPEKPVIEESVEVPTYLGIKMDSPEKWLSPALAFYFCMPKVELDNHEKIRVVYEGPDNRYLVVDSDEEPSVAFMYNYGSPQNLEATIIANGFTPILPKKFYAAEEIYCMYGISYKTQQETL